MTASFALRPSTNSALPLSDSSTFQPLSPEQLLGKWFIVHTSLPYWHDKRNIVIAYSAPSSPAPPTETVNDTITYQTLKSDKLRTVHGVNMLARGASPGAWDWRGSGWFKVVSNHWEILGHACGEGGEVGRWMVIHTQKSFFTPAAVHVYSRDNQSLPDETRKMLVTALAQWKDLTDLVEKMFAVEQQ